MNEVKQSFTLRFFLILLVISCSEKQQVTGLWELNEFTVDMYDRGFKPTYIKFEENGAFSVSKEDGDVAGLYSLDNSLIKLSSADEKWFNRSWRVIATDKELVLNDVKNSFRGAQMRFKKIDKFPPFEEFLEKLNGNWELYKIVEKGEEQRVKNTFFLIEDEHYAIYEDKEVIEEGNVSVDTRHHMMTFENMEITWDVRFVWDDLRLENEELGVMYRLRKIKR